MQSGVLIKWLGHACFVLKLLGGDFTLVIDPFPSHQVGYKPISVRADLVLISHDHFDHNYVRAVRGDPKVIKEAGRYKLGPALIVGYRTSHGDRRGPNIVFVVDLGGLRIAHCGDLGVLPPPRQIKKIGAIDVLLVPVGGYFTIDADKAWKLIQMVKPQIVIPMHYGHPQGKIRILAPLREFLKGKGNIRRFKTNQVKVTREKLPKRREIWVLGAP